MFNWKTLDDAYVNAAPGVRMAMWIIATAHLRALPEDRLNALYNELIGISRVSYQDQA